ncbi:hypothetical protein B0I37DRAFT_382768 [Chaetomium sp. MPI-CAGE-AT-0009]|nr:hypothetical protein B0I37DRAFT_382768 [Chaetomium sp. MPI-CAGE-AT-0009]
MRSQSSVYLGDKAICKYYTIIPQRLTTSAALAQTGQPALLHQPRIQEIQVWSRRMRLIAGQNLSSRGGRSTQKHRQVPSTLSPQVMLQRSTREHVRNINIINSLTGCVLECPIGHAGETLKMELSSVHNFLAKFQHEHGVLAIPFLRDPPVPPVFDCRRSIALDQGHQCGFCRGRCWAGGRGTWHETQSICQRLVFQPRCYIAVCHLSLLWTCVTETISVSSCGRLFTLPAVCRVHSGAQVQNDHRD